MPVALLLAYRFHTHDSGWIDPLFDLCLVLLAVQFIPNAWHAALVIGVMIAMAPSVAAHRSGHWIYGGFAVLLVAGMGVTALVHRVEHWLLPMIAVATTYPAIIYYARWQILRANRLRERSELLATMRQLTGSVAHDFNNTLMSITGHAELALLDLPDDHPATAGLRNIVDASTRAGSLSRQLLAFTGRDRGQQHQWDLNEELRILTSLLAPVVPKGVDILFHSQLSEAHVAFDRAELQQVLMNIVLNAGEAMRERPEPIRMTLSRHATRTGVAVVNVVDTGTGIPETQLPKVFDPYFTSKENGHGLGLATAKKIINSYGGAIHLASNVGRGTTVTLELPLAAPAAATAPRATNTTRPQRTALVVDDEEGVLKVTSSYLKNMGFEVSLATNVSDALLCVDTHPNHFDVVLLDLKMPGRDGWECLRELRSRYADQAVVICSSHKPPDDKTTSCTQRTVFLEKPFRLKDLQGAIQEVCTPTRAQRATEPRTARRAQMP